MNVPWPATDMCIAPRSHLSDGLLDVTFVRRIGRCALTKLFLGAETGTHESVGEFENVKARALRLKPTGTDNCIVAIDGEALVDSAGHALRGETEVRMFKGILNLIGR